MSVIIRLLAGIVSVLLMFYISSLGDYTFLNTRTDKRHHSPPKETSFSSTMYTFNDPCYFLLSLPSLKIRYLSREAPLYDTTTAYIRTYLE